MADDDDEGQMEDWSNQGLWRLDIKPQHADLVTLIADHNCLTKIDSLDKCPNLQQVLDGYILNDKSGVWDKDLAQCQPLWQG
nr:hypothetical protein BaRGS_018805 [Batillaria attramentaria]